MDEFQDTNGQQARLLRAGARGRAASMPWATSINPSSVSATPSRKGFERYAEEVRSAGGHQVELMENFRSRAEILRAVETVLAGDAAASSLAAWWRGARSTTPRPVAVELTARVGEA